MTVIPAYGRDYKSAAEATADWKSNKDFLIADVGSPYNGAYINREDYPGEVRIRYNRLRRVTFVRADAKHLPPQEHTL